MSIMNKLLAAMALSIACSAQAAPQTYHVDIDTTTLAGQDGYLDFLFLGLANAAPVQAQLSKFTGDFTAQSFAQGEVSGSIGSLLTIGNGAAWNEFGQWTHLGGKLSFNLSFDLAGIDVGGGAGAGATLSIALLDADLNYLGASGDVASFSLLPDSAPVINTDGAFATVSAVPEPAAYLMLAAGMALLLSLGRSARSRSSYQN